MLKRICHLAIVLAIGGGLAGCYVEEHHPDSGGGGGKVIEHDRVIHDNTPAEQNNIKVQNQTPANTDTNTKTQVEQKKSTTTTTP